MGWIDKISQGIKTTFNAVRPPMQAIPTILLICEAKNRPGLSAIALTSAIIQRFPEAGIPTGVNPDGSPNIIAKMTRIMIEEIVNEIKNNGKVIIGAEPGQTTVTGVAAGVGGGAVTATLSNFEQYVGLPF